MVRFDASESLTPFRGGGGGYGSILSDAALVRQVEPGWFDPGFWGERARPVDSGGRGGAWFVDTPAGPAVLRQYLRGGFAARFSRAAHLWRGATRVRSFAEFRLTRDLLREGMPVPEPLAASYVRGGASYRAAILVRRLDGVRSFADRVAVAAGDAPWEEVGRLVARFHRVGLDHADLNAHNILFDAGGNGWLIDFDLSRQRLPETGWRSRNLARLERSLLKLRGSRTVAEVRVDFARLRAAYDARWAKGY
ncbi:3-deoxy-D-manno-octulosonic acid kinase [Luteimonas sp. SJ-92]|uniref:3-deoxy-D-manno-octulosonic acid kinase n=1 Tax=Luteimonas salinisoli TaxID=2752307 RepID=A0A853JDW6_9GAMM|nr:3-deoxy-D-manno-octulosonic acid kinase [Luteimonas salinisoli]NZA27521.1 3-deoxy-D-manno-octulosonic acid kinase [Luteimonas salinisoli]